MTMQMAFPNPSDTDPEFLAFALLCGTLMSGMIDGSVPIPEGITTLWVARQSDVKAEIVDFAPQLNRRVAESGGILDRLQLPPETVFRGAGVRYRGPDGKSIIELLACGLQHDGPPPEPSGEAEQEFNEMVTQAAEEAGFVISHDNLRPGAILTASTGIEDTLRASIEKQISAETEKFRDELDKVFDTWKGET